MRPRVTTLLLAALCAPLAAVAQDAAQPASVRHLPPAEVAAGEPLVLTADVSNGFRLARLEARWRPAGGAWRTTAFGKTADGHWAARIEGDDVRPPRIEYFVTAQEEAHPAVDWFASAARPHPVLVLPSDEEIVHRDRLLRYRGLTSRARMFGEYASFGPYGRDASGRAYQDRYHQLEVDYLFRTLSKISYIRLGYVNLRGDVPPPAAFGREPLGAVVEAQRPSGMDYGFAEVALDGTDLVGFTGKLILGADEAGFASGVGGAIRIGPDTSAHLEIGGQTIQRVGGDAFVRLAWDTVPRWPMALGLHVTNIPAATLKPGGSPTMSMQERTDAGAPVGLRIVYDVGFEVTQQVTIFVRGGYQARVATSGGPAVGGGMTVAW